MIQASDMLAGAKIVVYARDETKGMTDARWDELYGKAEDALNQIETMIRNLYGEGGQFHNDQIAVKFEHDF